MPAYKNKDNGTWYVMTQYTNWKGERKPKCKRGFDTKREAQEWEQTFRQQNSGDLDMPFSAFVEIYCREQKPRLKESTWQTKENIIQQKILPYFENYKINEITTKDVRAWQNEMLAYRNEENKPYSSSYLKTLHNQLSAIFNYAVRFYDLRSNPAAKAGNMGSEERKEMLFWTKEEYQKFSEVMMDKPISYYAFQMLYWTGIREGDDDDKIRLNQRKPSKYKGLSRFGPEKNLQRINKFMKERPIFYKNLIQMKENIRFYLRCFYCITKVVILQFNSEKQDRISS